MSRQLIVNADDFGRTRGTSAGIIRAHLNGIVTGTTAMMNLPGVVNDLHQAQAEAPELGLGVHLNFTAGRPLLPLEWVPSLVDGRGRFLSHEALEANPECLNPDELRSELKAQITAFRNAMGRFPDHLDAHHFAHLHPSLFGIYLDLADDFRLPARVPFPQTGAELEHLPLIAGAVPPETVKAIIHADQQLLARRSIKTPGHFLMTFYDERATLEHLLQLLENLSEGVSELMTHPGVADEQLRNESSYNLQREREITVLTDPRVPAHLAELGIQLITFADL